MRSTLKYDIIISLNIGFYFLKTKIIYICGNEIFDMTEIRAAFDEVRNALNLDKKTVLFGVPVDEDDAGLAPQQSEPTQMPVEEMPETIVESVAEIEPEISEPVVEKPKRTRAKKGTVAPEETVIQQDNEVQDSNDSDEKIVPILSILSGKESSEDVPESTNETQTESIDEIEIIEDVAQEAEEIIEPEPDDIVETIDEETDEPDLEKLLSEMKPLNEDILEEQDLPDDEKQNTEEEPENIDATLEKLATEFVQTQDKISSAIKSSSRSKIGKLRNILPFKQSKHHDQGLGDLFGWAGVAVNDEEFSVPGFFTTASSKK